MKKKILSALLLLIVLVAPINANASTKTTETISIFSHEGSIDEDVNEIIGIVKNNGGDFIDKKSFSEKDESGFIINMKVPSNKVDNIVNQLKESKNVRDWSSNQENISEDEHNNDDLEGYSIMEIRCYYNNRNVIFMSAWVFMILVLIFGIFD